MKRLTILLFAICCLSCKSSHSQHKPDPEAIRLTNEAFFLGNDSLYIHRSDSTLILKKAMNLVNKALQIDSNYFFAYRDKADFQTKLGHPDSALTTAKFIIKKWPKEISITISIGEYYEIKGDTISTAGYYKKALFVVNHVLDSIGVNNRRYGSRQIEKAKVLMLLNQPEKAHAILKELIEKATNDNDKQFLNGALAMNRHDILYGKTIGTKNLSTTINW